MGCGIGSGLLGEDGLEAESWDHGEVEGLEEGVHEAVLIIIEPSDSDDLNQEHEGAADGGGGNEPSAGFEDGRVFGVASHG